MPTAQELYTQPYASIPWPSLRNRISPADVYAPHSGVANALFAAFDCYDRVAPAWVRRKGLERAYRLVVMEDENTAYQTVGPVSKAMNMLCVSPVSRLSPALVLARTTVLTCADVTQVSLAGGGPRERGVPAAPPQDSRLQCVTLLTGLHLSACKC